MIVFTCKYLKTCDGKYFSIYPACFPTDWDADKSETKINETEEKIYLTFL